MFSVETTEGASPSDTWLRTTMGWTRSPVKEFSFLQLLFLASRSTTCEVGVGARLMSGGKVETDAEFDARYEAYFNRKDIDGWELRKAMTDLVGMDLVPEPTIIVAALRACRRLNDYALTVRILEVVKMKCGDKEKEIWPYIMQEIRPTLDELGISTLEEMGYDKPELALPNPYD